MDTLALRVPLNGSERVRTSQNELPGSVIHDVRAGPGSAMGPEPAQSRLPAREGGGTVTAKRRAQPRWARTGVGRGPVALGRQCHGLLFPCNGVQRLFVGERFFCLTPADGSDSPLAYSRVIFYKIVVFSIWLPLLLVIQKLK